MGSEAKIEGKSKTFRLILILWSLFLIAGIEPGKVGAERIKDISHFQGIRQNDLIGYGLVVGLDGTGDKDGAFLIKAYANMLTRLGLNVTAKEIKSKAPKNVASVIVTSKLSTMTRPGTRIDVLVSSIGDAKTLQGGTLLMTPLTGPDGKVYAVAQGPVSIGGFSAGGGGTGTVKNHPNVGRIPNGAVVERDISIDLDEKQVLELLLTESDITTAVRITEKINGHLSGPYAHADSPSSISIAVPDTYREKVVQFMADIEGIDVSVDVPARVVLNERTGTIVIGQNVSIRPVALAQGNLTIEISTDYTVSQPPPFSPDSAQTVVVPQRDVQAEEKAASLMEVKGATVGELVKALNALGVTPRDLIAILQAIKASGNLQAELVLI